MQKEKKEARIIAAEHVKAFKERKPNKKKNIKNNWQGRKRKRK